MNAAEQATKAEAFRALHRGPRALSAVRDAVRDVRANGRFDAISPSVTGADMAQLWAKK
jgi:hypothetical protein